MNNTLLDRLSQLMPDFENMALPPNIFIDMEGEFIEFVENKKLVARFPNMERYRNPLGLMQGGIIIAAMDNTVSPLSYLVAPPSITQSIETVFKKPVKQSDAYIDVVATVLEKTSTHILMQGEAMNPKGKVVAGCVAKSVYIKGMRHGKA